MGQFLTTASTLMCPHGGTVTAITSNTKAKAGGDYILRSSDTFIVAGCPFILVLIPDPCIQVQWVVSALQNTVMDDAVLTTDSVGLCISALGPPAGPVVIASTQAQVSGL
jgi:hypothetical protein